MLLRLVTFSLILFSIQAFAAQHAVILQYHHISAQTPALTSVDPETFQQHLDYLEQQAFTPWPLAKILDHLAKNQPLPEKTIAITFDDAYRSVLDEAAPRLQAKGWPFTLFVTTDPIDLELPGFLTWDELKQIKAAGGSLANHSQGHGHLLLRLPGETQAQWRQRISTNIQSAQQQIVAMTGPLAPIFAYPYGEYNQDLQQLLEELGYFALGQHSGAVGPSSDFTALPRFPASGIYANLETLAVKLESRPFPVTQNHFPDPLLTPSQTPRLKIDLAPGDYQAQQLRCYLSGSSEPLIPNWHNEQQFDLTVSASLTPGRNRCNCTAPSADGSYFYWLSQLWIMPPFGFD